MFCPIFVPDVELIKGAAAGPIGAVAGGPIGQRFKDMDCAALLKKIKETRDELAKRFDDLARDAKQLPQQGKMSVQVMSTMHIKI